MVPEWVLDSGISDGALRLYAVLALEANERGEAWPKRKSLADRLRCSTDTVDRRVKDLVEVGAIEVRPFVAHDGGRGSNTYVVHFERGWIR